MKRIDDSGLLFWFAGILPFFESRCEQDYGWMTLLHQKLDIEFINRPPQWGVVAVPLSCSCKILPKFPTLKQSGEWWTGRHEEQVPLTKGKKPMQDSIRRVSSLHIDSGTRAGWRDEPWDEELYNVLMEKFWSSSKLMFVVQIFISVLNKYWCDHTSPFSYYLAQNNWWVC